ncbi:MAG: ABC transporter permease subunit [Synechococcaceae cyanobacterium]|nr:ABC transporter permease subunit [Synechococcaceae cyanobacterium]
MSAPQCRWPRRWALLLLTMTLALGLGLGQPGRAAKSWTVGTDPTYAPFGMKDEATGALQGFDIDLIKAIARRSGHPIQLTPLPFDGLIPALQARSLDLAISAMTITASRAQTVDFSRPYFAAGLGIVVRDGTSGITSLKDLQGRSIAVQIGSTGAKAMAAVPGARLSNFDSAPLALQELINGNVEAYVNDLPATLYAIETIGLRGIHIAGKPLTQDFYGLAFPKGSPLREPVNRALAQVLADGTYARIYRRWFGQAPPPLPARAPALEHRGQKATFDGLRLLRNLAQGAGVTLALTLCSFGLGLIGAGLVTTGLLGRQAFVRRACRLYVDFFRGTPLLVQLFMIYFGLPALSQALGLEINPNRFAAAVLAFSLNAAAYLAETLRGGIASIDRGQWEAANALALRPLAKLRHVILPQALQRVLPSLANEFIALIKDTSLAAVIGFDELFRQGQLVVATTYRAFEVYLAVALLYLLMTSLAALLFKRWEQQLSPTT